MSKGQISMTAGKVLIQLDRWSTIRDVKFPSGITLHVVDTSPARQKMRKATVLLLSKAGMYVEGGHGAMVPYDVKEGDRVIVEMSAVKSIPELQHYGLKGGGVVGVIWASYVAGVISEETEDSFEGDEIKPDPVHVGKYTTYDV